MPSGELMVVVQLCHQYRTVMRTKPRVGRIAAPLQRRDGAMLAGKAESEHAGIVSEAV